MISFGRLFAPSVVVILGTPPAAQTVTTIDGNGLRVAFEVSRSLTSAPDTARCSIFNLSEPRRKAAQTVFGEVGKLPLSIAAGYDGVTVDLFRGDVRQMRAGRRSGPNVLTEAWADDAGDALADVNITLSTAGIDAATLIDIALAAYARGGHPVPTAEPAVITKHPSVAATLAATSPEATVQMWAAVHVGKASQLLDQAARLLEARWWVRNNQLFMAKRKLPTDGLAVVLPRSHWLTEPDDDGSGIVRLMALMDPNIEPGRLVTLESLPGVRQQYRCETAKYRGDTESGPWSVDMQLRRST